MKAGDKVLYVPSECHLLSMDAKGEFCFEWINDHSGHPRAGQEETTERLVKVGGVKKDNNGRFATKKGGMSLKPGKPRFGWPATIKTVNEDGSADLEIEDPRGGVTLEYPKVKCDPDGNSLHSFHAV